MKPLPPLCQKASRFLANLPAIQKGVVIAVSGGPDSVALAMVLAKQDLQVIDKLVIAHLNHQLRGQESDADENFVKDFFKALSCKTTC